MSIDSVYRRPQKGAMVTTTRGTWRAIGLAVLSLLAGRAAADHATLNDLVGVKFSTNPRHRSNDIGGGRSTWAARHSPTVELFVLSPISSSSTTPATTASSAVAVAATTEKKTPDATENARPTPQPRPRLKAATMDSGALLAAPGRSAADLGEKERAFFQKFAGDIEARCALAMSREKIEPVEGMTVHYIIEIATHSGTISVKKLNYPIQVGSADFFLSIIQDMSPLPQTNVDLSKSFGDVVRLEITLS